MKLFSWALTNAGMYWLAYAAIVNHSEGAGNLLVALSWFFAVSSFICCLNKDDPRIQEAAKNTVPVPPWVSHLVGFGMVALLVWNAWWWTAFAMLWNEFSEAVLRESAKPKTKPCPTNSNE